MSLAEQQQALLAAIRHGGAAPAGVAGAGTGAGLAAYRRNARTLAARALREGFASVAAELGDEAFAAMAWRFWREHPPVRGDLGEWGGELAGFLARHAGEASGLPHLARRDWALSRAERAVDAVLDADSLQLLAGTPPERLQLDLRPGVALVDGSVLVWREGWRARWQALPAGDAAFVAALLRGDSLAAALAAAEPGGFDFGAWLQAALRHAWLLAARG
ncbi:MAG: DNA-binding domain-containing protein [Roseateles sp.]|uniref:HvfC/BufC N-terminal domain-containing protein n=1 Tax=Roseateles sp. TaxID=1971397 RepID=UPI0039EA1FEA